VNPHSVNDQRSKREIAYSLKEWAERAQNEIARTRRGARRPEPKLKEKEAESAAIKSRSRCGFVRGNPVLNSHFSPAPAQQVGQRVACTFLTVGFLAFMVMDDAANPQGKMVNLAQ